MTKGRPPAFTPEQAAQICAEYATSTQAELARRYACDVTTIKRLLRLAGISTRQPITLRLLTDAQAQALVTDYAAMSLTQLAIKYGCSHATARSYLIRAGVPRRPRGGPNYKGRKVCKTD